MSRFGVLQRQYQHRKTHWDDHWDYLELNAQELADDFGLWLSRGENGQPDQFCQPIPVSVLARFLSEDGDEVFSGDLSAGQVDESLHLALEVRVADDSAVRPPSVLRLRLVMELYEEDVKVTVTDFARPYRYSRTSVPEDLFEALFRLCEGALNV